MDSVNAVNATLMKAALARYASVLPAPVPEDVVAMLAESSEGDLRHAIMSLLMFGKGRVPAPSRPRHSTSDDPGAKRGAKRKPKYASSLFSFCGNHARNRVPHSHYRGTV